jgi:lipopolysaccharide assembly outer membrane protein LptD (OstA)
MPRFTFTLCLGLLLLLATTRLQADEEEPIIIEGLSDQSVVEHDFQNRVSTGKNGVMVKHGKTLLIADQVTLNEIDQTIVAQGNVSVQQEGQFWTGEKLEYNYQTRKISGETFKTGSPPVFVSGMSLNAGTTEKVYSATNAIITTDDVSEPSYMIRAKNIEMLPGKSIVAHNAKLYVAGVPVMFFPVYHRSLERHTQYYTGAPGYRSRWGAYLMNSYHWFPSETVELAVNADFRQRRGIGYGPEMHYDLGRWGKGDGNFYWIKDAGTEIDPQTKDIGDQRRRLSFSHQMTLRTNLTLKATITEQSDPFVARDYFEDQYRQHAQPPSFLEINQAWPNFTLDLLALGQADDFFQSSDRLPDLKLTGIRQQLGVSPFYYESETSAGYYRFRPGFDGGTNYAAFRGDTFHQILLPKTFFGWLNITPRVGGRFTYYDETDRYGRTADEQDREVFNTGAEASFKASRVWPTVENKFFDVNGLRHIIEPSVNYVYVPSPNRPPKELPQFDTEIPSLRLLPIDFPDYNAIDSIDAQNVMRLSVRNKLQTKRGGEVDNLVNWAVYTDWRINPRLDQGAFADIFSDLDFRPRKWLTLNSETRFDVDDRRWRAANHSATISPNDVWSITLGHRYFRDDPTYGIGNNLIYDSIYYRLNENWGFRMSHHYEARDGFLEEQYYTLYRDLRSWTAALTFRVRQQRIGPTDFTVGLTFSLKAFPHPVGRDRDNPSLLLGG